MKTRKNSGRRLALTATMAAAIGLFALPYGAAAAPLSQAGDVGPPSDAYACEANVLPRAAKALGFAGTDLWTGGNSTCRLDPAHEDHAIVALVYVPGEEKTGKQNAEEVGNNLDLDLVVLDLKNDKVLAHRHESQSIDDGGDALEGISIDTARYVLAPGQRAFGISISNATRCYCANSRDVSLTLYLQRGDKLDEVGGAGTYSWQAGTEKGDTPPPCTNKSSKKTSTVGVGKGTSHGLADLVLTTLDEETWDDEDVSKCPVLKPTKTIKTLHYDGATYK